ncbi:MAG: bifunctional aldolase/short-chain dehydrogenase [Lentisphaeria bacterium]|jgi:rhamnose utilization protein RhaD (predicted bifunctional aldolase and dehydrogenase)/NAD(P)-dependent dehydrogenase (short-subunit alcohol dehydrogenase family)|nr:bifunctional aldolase/short-chain dehydrogenase [Lentisphaeria bacterium]
MKSLWDDAAAPAFADDPLQLRVYTSRLLGQEPALVMHGGGNTSVKMQVDHFFGEPEEVLCIKGSGWNLATIEAAGFAPVKLDVLQRLAQLEKLTDTEMVNVQRRAMTDPGAPNPSVEAILHAIIPGTFVDHTHADAVVALSNTPNGEAAVRDIYGGRVLVVPYVMPGFLLARMVYEMSRDLDWSALEGMILLNHGVFSFGDDARTSYERMIKLVSEAEDHLDRRGALKAVTLADEPAAPADLEKLSRVRRKVSQARGGAVVAPLVTTAAARGFAGLDNVGAIANRGPLTPDHVIRTKQLPVIIGDDADRCIDQYATDYEAYFQAHTDGRLKILDPAPRWAVWPGVGTISFGRSMKEAGIVEDISRHTCRAIQWAEALGGWQALPARDLFDVEYWELEQAKLGKAGSEPPLQGRIALVTGAASGIGRACARELRGQGALVTGLDIDAAITGQWSGDDGLGVQCDVTDYAAVQAAVEATVRQFGGLDILVCNAGIFPPSCTIADMDADIWQKAIDINLTSSQRLMQLAAPYLKNGIDAAVVIIASKNVPAPGPGAAAYSVSKAGLTQLARVAAMELAPDGVRVNVLHPNAVFDTALWAPEILAARAEHYGMTIEQYKTNNLLGVEVTAADVAAMAAAMAGPLFRSTTGAQVPVDGGNERVI